MALPSRPGRKIDDRHLRLEYLGGRCAVCRRSLKAVERRYLTSKGVFEFNHIDPGRKSPIYEKLIRRVISAAQLEELDKCNLLCRICHAIWTNQRLKGKLQVTIGLPDGRVVKKRFGHHGLMEFEKGKPKIHIFADEPCNLELYGHSLGRGRRVYRVGFELEKQLCKLLLATRRRRKLRIWDKKGLVFVAERQDVASVRIQYAVRFPLLQFEGEPDSPRSPHVWVRHGKVVIEGQSVRTEGLVSFMMEYVEIVLALSPKAAEGTL